MWVATAFNLDWPSRQGLSHHQQTNEINEIVARAKELNFNVIMLQVRAFGDRIHRFSNLPTKEPWGRALNFGHDPDRRNPLPGVQQQYDPLAEWIRACHRNGIELHCWINPFRVHGPRPTAYKGKDGNYYLLNPTDQAVQDHVLDVIEDLLKYSIRTQVASGAPASNSPKMMVLQPAPSTASTASTGTGGEDDDIDGIVIDHYYPPPDPEGGGADSGIPNAVELSASAEGARPIGARVARVRSCPATDKPYDDFLCEIMALVSKKPGAKLGMSPDHDNEDAQRWVEKGLCHYIIPELYFKVGMPDDFSKNLRTKWLDKNTHNAPGNDPDRLRPIVVAGLRTTTVEIPMNPKDPNDTPWEASEILKQVGLAKRVRPSPGNPRTKDNTVSGHAHFSYSSLRSPQAGGPPKENNIGDKLKHKKNAADPNDEDGPCAEPALVPMCVKNVQALDKPDVTFDAKKHEGTWGLARREDEVLFWAVWTHADGAWGPMVLHRKGEKGFKFDDNVDGIAVQAIDRYNANSEFGVAP